MKISTTPAVPALFLLIGSMLAIGCATARDAAEGPVDNTGFLSTYSRLEPASETSMSYLDPSNRLARYTKFIVMPVEVKQYTATDVTAEEIETIKRDMHKAIVDALSERYEVVTEPTGDTAEVRVAVTNIKKSTPILNVIPRPKISDIGLGGLSVEAEVIDSVSNVQIAALIESRVGQNRNIDFSTLDDSRAVMQDWADRLVSIVDESRATAGVTP